MPKIRATTDLRQLILIVPGEPLPQPRARVTVRGKHAHAYTPTTKKDTTTDKNVSNGVAEYKALIRLVAAHEYTGQPFEKTPFRVDCEFVFPRLESMKFWPQPEPRIRHSIKPDRDNLDKMVLDSLTGIIFTNDSCVSSGLIDKWYAAGGEQPHALIRITRLA